MKVLRCEGFGLGKFVELKFIEVFTIIVKIKKILIRLINDKINVRIF